MDRKYTQGPFEKRPWGKQGAVSVARVGKMPHATFFPARSGRSDFQPTEEDLAQVEADINLYFAAEKLLDACKSALALIEVSTDYAGMSTSQELRAAIDAAGKGM